MDPNEALKNIKTLAEAATDANDIEVMRKHFEMIVFIADRVLKAKLRSPAHGQ